MRELSAFIEAKKSGKNPNLKLLPIFFMIKPRELSRITRDSPEWEKLGVDNDTRGEWEEALKDVRSIHGLTFSEDGNEVELRKKAVKEICCHLKGINLPKLLEFKPVGIEEQVREVKSLLDMEGAQSALAVIICGFGGMGKSTLAASVVESLDWSSLRDFKFCRVAIYMNPQDKTSHIKELQKIILSDLGGVDVDLRDTLDGRVKIKEALKNKCSLLFIDNVVDKEDIRDLLPPDLSYSGQSTKLRIIITSRENDLKAKVRIMWKEYEVKALSYTSSKLLLSETIEQSHEVANIGRDEEERLIEEVASACKGVPLLLSIFGGYLRDERDNENYQQVLRVLREGNLDSYRDEDLGTKLMYVYNKIKNVEVKEAFLDICSYFHGWKWDLVVDILDNYVLEELHRKMLVSKSCSGEVIIHDILLLMGLKEASHDRFLNWKSLSDNLENDLKDVKGISLVSHNHLITVTSKQLEAMHQSLRVLELGDWVTLEGPPCQKAFPNLRYLNVRDITAFPFNDASKLGKLRLLHNRSQSGMNLSHLPSSLKRIYHEVPPVDCDEFENLPLQNLSFLKSLIMRTSTSSLFKLPEAFHLPASLVYLELSRCKNIPENIGHLTALESLILDRSDLKRLPEGIGKLERLKYLSMNDCSELSFLSDGLGMLSSLERLSMKYCFSLQLLPESFGELRISSLKLDHLTSLKELPNGFGNMPFLKDLSLEYCISLMSLPDSFVQLKMLETLKIYCCNKLTNLPKDFGQLRCLKHMTVEGCDLLKELPCGFGALPALKTFKLQWCDSFKNLCRDFGELTSLELLHLVRLPFKRIPHGFGKLKGLKLLFLEGCSQLKTLSHDFENMATLERLTIWNCRELDGSMMEKIVKLRNCSMAYIGDSTKLLEKWKQMNSRIELPFLVFSGDEQFDGEVEKRGLMEALLNGECVDVNKSSGQLMGRSSLLGGLQVGTTATVALIILPSDMLSREQQRCIQYFAERASERAESNGWGMLQFVCARRLLWTDRSPTLTEEEEREKEEDIRQILLSMPEGWCALSKRVKILTAYTHMRWCYECSYSYTNLGDSKLMFFLGHVVVDMERSKRFENFKEVRESEISETVILGEEEEEEEMEEEEMEMEEKKCIFQLMHSILYDRRVGAGQSETRKFIEGLKGNGIDHLLIKGKKVMVDDLHGKPIGFIKCKLILSEWIKFIQMDRDLQLNSDFFVVLIPTDWPTSISPGYGSCSRLSQRMPWAIIPHDEVFTEFRDNDSTFLVLDKEGRIANEDAFPLLLGWGLKFYPFTQDSIRERFFMMESKPFLEILLDGMDIVGRKPMKSKMTFLYVARPTECHEMKCKLEELTQIHGGFEILYLGERFHRFPNFPSQIEHLKQKYEDATQKMSWPSLSISDWFMFWNRCRYFARDCKYVKLYRETNKMQAVRGLAQKLYNSDGTRLVLVENDGVVTWNAEDVMEMICELTELTESRGECSVFPFMKTWFGDEIDNHPQHPQHRLSRSMTSFWEDYVCNVCSLEIDRCQEKRSYACGECRWHMCGNCWMACAKLQAQQLVRANDH